LKGSDGQSLALSLAGYQFPDLASAEYDSNWLTVTIDVAHPRGNWRASDPCLLTYEAARLAAWLDGITPESAVGSEESFVEPCLVFSIVDANGGRALRVYFELECRPAWASARAAGQEDLWVQFPLSELDLKAAARELREQLLRYPQRAAR
jgi:hypothetical protein